MALKNSYGRWVQSNASRMSRCLTSLARLVLGLGEIRELSIGGSWARQRQVLSLASENQPHRTRSTSFSLMEGLLPLASRCGLPAYDLFIHIQ